MDDAAFLDYLEHSGRLTSPDNVTPAYRRELLRLMAGFVDSELAAAAGFAGIINQAPTLSGQRLMARMVLEKICHGEQVLTLMQPFGTDPELYAGLHRWDERVARLEDLGSERQSGDMRLNVFHYPLAGWLDALVMNLLMGEASLIQLDELAGCSYQPLADSIAEILPAEEDHLHAGLEKLRSLASDDSRLAEIRSSLAYWQPRVEASFGSDQSPRFEPLSRFGLRHKTNRDLRARWSQAVEVRLRELGVAQIDLFASPRDLDNGR